MTNTISKKRERLFDKLREIYYDFDRIYGEYRNEHKYNENIRKDAERMLMYVWAFRDVEEYMTIEWLEFAIERSQRLLNSLREKIQKEEA